LPYQALNQNTSVLCLVAQEAIYLKALFKNFKLVAGPINLQRAIPKLLGPYHNIRLYQLNEGGCYIEGHWAIVELDAIYRTVLPYSL
jgi:hypothetical protein